MAANFNGDYGYIGYNRPPVTYWLPTSASEVEAQKTELNYYLGPPDKSEACLRDLTLMYNLNDENSCFEGSSLSYFYIWVRHKACAANIDYGTYTYGSTPDIASLQTDRITVTPERVSYGTSSFFNSFLENAVSAISEATTGKRIVGYTGVDVPASGKTLQQTVDEINNATQRDTNALIANYRWGFDEDFFGSNHYHDAYVTGIWTRYKVTVNWRAISKYTRLISIVLPVYMQTANSNVCYVDPEEGKGDITTKYEVVQWKINIKMAQTVVDNPVVPTDRNYWCYDFPARRFTKEEREYLLKVRYPQNIYTDSKGNKNITLKDTYSVYPFGVSTEVNGNLLLHNAWAGTGYKPDDSTQKTFQKNLIQALMSTYPVLDRLNMEISSSIWYSDINSLKLASRTCGSLWPDTIPYEAPVLALTAFTKSETVAYGSPSNTFSAKATDTLFHYRVYDITDGTRITIVLSNPGKSIWAYEQSLSGEYTGSRTYGSSSSYVNVINEFPFSYSDSVSDTYSFTYLLGANSNPTCLIAPSPTLLSKKNPTTKEPITYLIEIYPAISETSSEELAQYYGVAAACPNLFRWTVKVYNKDFYPGITDPNTINNVSEEYIDTEELKYNTSEQEAYNMNLRCVDTNEGTTYSSTSLLFKQNSSNYYSTMKSKDQVLFAGNYSTENNTNALFTEMNGILSSVKEGSIVDVYTPGTESISFTLNDTVNVYSAKYTLQDLAAVIKKKVGTSEDIYLFGMVIEAPKVTEDAYVGIFEDGDFSTSVTYSNQSNIANSSTLTLSAADKNTLYFSDIDSNGNFTQKIDTVGFPFLDQYGVFNQGLKLDSNSSAYIQLKYPGNVTYKNYRYSEYNEDTPLPLEDARSRFPLYLPPNPWPSMAMPTRIASGFSDVARSNQNLWGMYLRYVKLNMDDTANPYLDITVRVLSGQIADYNWYNQLHTDTVLHSAIRLTVSPVTTPEDPISWGSDDDPRKYSTDGVYGNRSSVYKYLDDIYVYPGDSHKTSYTALLTDEDGNPKSHIYQYYKLYLKDLVKITGTTYAWYYTNWSTANASAEDFFKNFGQNFVWKLDYIIWSDTNGNQTGWDLDKGTIVSSVSNVFSTQCNSWNQLYCTDIMADESGDFNTSLQDCMDIAPHTGTFVRIQLTDENAIDPKNFGQMLQDVLFTYSDNGETKYHIIEEKKNNEKGYSAYYMNINQFTEDDLATYSDPNSTNYNEIFGNILGISEYEDAKLEVTWYSSLEPRETKTTKLLRVTIPATTKGTTNYISHSYSTDYSLDTFVVKASFLYWYKSREGTSYKTEVPELLKSEEKYKVFNVAKVSNDVDYDYTPYMNNSSREKRVFKANEEYKLGIVFKYQDGTVSPVYDGSYVNKNQEEVGLKDVWIPGIEPSILSIPEIEDYATTNPVYDQDVEAQKRFITAKKSVRVIQLHPSISNVLSKYNITSIIPVRLHRTNTKIKAQGIINPGVTTKDLNNTIGVDAQYDWFYRETLVNHAVWLPSYKSDPNTTSVTPTSNTTNNTNEDKSEKLWSGGTNSKQAPDWINNFDIEIQSLDDSSREAEKTGLVSSGTLLTFNSPELEMDETFSQYMLQGTRLRHLKTYNDVTYGNNVELQYNGANRLSSFETSDIYQNTGTLSAENCLDMVYPKQYLDAEDLGSIDALKEMYAAKDSSNSKTPLASLKVSLKGMKHHKFKSGFLWYGYGPFGATSTEEAIKNATLITDVTENYAFFKVYPWMRNRLGGEVGDDYTIKTKRYFSQTYATGASYYTPAVKDIYISGVTISNSQTNIIHKLYNTTTNKSCLYQGTTDAIVVASALNSQGAYRIRCRGDWYTSTGRQGNDSWCYTTASQDTGSTAPSIGGIQQDLCRDPIQMRYKAAPHAVFFFNGGSMSTSKKGVNVGELYNVNELPELRTENYIQGTWIPCGKQVPLSLNRNWTTIVFEEGDFFFGRFDSLRTQPYTDDDVNQVTEVVSTMLCSRINLDARYDSNRGVKTPTISNTNFNLRNPVYDQLNNYFTYSYQDVKDLNSTRKYKSTIQWSLQKTMGETIDSWCDIQDSNFLDFNGTLGSIISINSLGNNIIVFQENGIAVLQYNEKTQLATNTGVPVEIANSNKVEGKYYITQSIGCQSTKAIAETPSGIYFIDSTRKTLYYLAPNLELKDISLQGLKAWSKRNLDSKWCAVYDSIAEEVLFINNDEALVYDIAHQCFSSFLTYGNIKHWFRMGPYTCQVKPLSYELVADIEQVQGKDIGIYNNNNYFGIIQKVTPTTTIWLRNTQEASSLFGTTVPQTIEWICNPSPINDKIFTNIQYRADAFCEDDTYISDDTFDTIRLIDEYQDTYKNLLYWRKHTVSNLKKKFRMWNITIPRAQELTDINDQYSYTRDRIRNMWCKIQLKHDSINITEGNTSKGYWKQIPFKNGNTPVILDTTDMEDKEYGKTLPDRNSSSYSDGDIFNLIDDNNQIIHKYMFHKSARLVFYDAQVSYLPC